MATNSKQKGKRGERECAEYLRSIGFADAQRTQQYNGLGKSDVICPQSLPRVHIEVKYGYPTVATKGNHNIFDIGTGQWEQACIQADRECEHWPIWCVLWRPRGGRAWRLTMRVPIIGHGTFATDEEIKAALQWLQDYKPTQ